MSFAKFLSESEGVKLMRVESINKLSESEELIS